MSYFHRPFGSANDAPPSASLARQLSDEWEHLESRFRHGGPLPALQADLAAFLRRWGVAVAEAPSNQQGPLGSLLESARASLLSQLSAQKEAHWQKSQEKAQQERGRAAAQAEIQRLQQETRQIQEDTRRATLASHDRNFQLMKSGLFPEQHCPYCCTAYLDLSGGCWNCQKLHRPGYF